MANLGEILYLSGSALSLYSLFFTIPVFVGLVMGQVEILPFLVPGILSIVFGYFFRKAGVVHEELNPKEVVISVVFTWSAVCILGAIPFFLCQNPQTVLNSLFESVSGFTTTGASVFSSLSEFSSPILFWRSFTQWIGGMGILVLVITLLPPLGAGGAYLLNVEKSSFDHEKIQPTIRDTAKYLLRIYLLLSVVLAISLYCLGMNPFDSITHTFTTMSSGGFSPHTEGIAGFHSPWIRITLILFMILSATSFSLHYAFLFKRRILDYIKSLEFKVFLLILTVASFLVFLDLQHNGSIQSLFSTLLDIVFTVVSLATTTGFAVIDFNQWPEGSRVLCILLMIIGGCAGSTAGGIKVIRALVVVKYINQELLKISHPQLVSSMQVDGHNVSEQLVKHTLAFVLLYIVVVLTASLLLCFDGADFTSAISASASCLGGVGPGLNLAGPMTSYSSFGVLSKLSLMLLMFFGRVEIYVGLVVFTGRFWRD